jgi:hypothetical protein
MPIFFRTEWIGNIMHEIKYRGFNTIGKNFASSGKVLPRTMKTKPSPHENIINKNQLNTNIRILVTEYSSPKPTLSP